MYGDHTISSVRFDVRWVTFAVFSCLIALVACADGNPPPGELDPLPQVDLSTLEPALSVPLSAQLAMLRLDPADASANGEAAKLLQAFRHPELALQFYRRARVLEPSSLQWPYYEGVIQASQGLYDEAIASFTSVLALAPGNLPAEKRRARALLDKGSLEESLRIYKALLVSAPSDPEIRNGIGKVHAALGNAEEAAAHLSRAVEILPNYGEAHYALALVYRDLGDEKRAAEHLRRYEEDQLGAPTGSDPLMASVNSLNSSAVDYLKAGVEAQKAGRIREAIGYNLKALELDPNLHQAYAGLIVLYGLVGDFDTARLHYEKALALNPNSVAVHYNYGRLLYDEGSYRQAREAFQRALELNPDDAFTNNAMGEASEQLGRAEDAARYYRRAVANRPDFDQAHFNLGRTMMQAGRLEEAVGELELSLREETFRTPTFLATLASAYAVLGRLPEAAQTFALARQMAQRYGQDELVRTIDGSVRRLSARAARR